MHKHFPQINIRSCNINVIWAADTQIIPQKKYDDDRKHVWVNKWSLNISTQIVLVLKAALSMKKMCVGNGLSFHFGEFLVLIVVVVGGRPKILSWSSRGSSGNSGAKARGRRNRMVCLIIIIITVMRVFESKSGWVWVRIRMEVMEAELEDLWRRRDLRRDWRNARRSWTVSQVKCDVLNSISASLSTLTCDLNVVLCLLWM